MPGKHLDLDLDNNLGGDNPADVYIPSQKAIKTYVDGEITVVNGKIDAIEIVDELAELQDVNLSEVTDGQALTYDAATQKWKNGNIDKTTNWGSIGGTLSEQTDLQDALDGKAEATHTHTKNEITDLAIPSKTSELTNDSGFISSIPSEYITETELSTELQGYQTKITSTAKLNADLVTDANQTNKFVTAAQMSTWNGKQDAITDLSTIRAGASAGATALQAGDNVSALTNDAGYLTSADISSVFVYKGTKATKSQLPTTGNKKGDVWTVTEDGSEYVWDGSDWQYLGEVLDLSGYVQTNRTINGKALTSDITLNYSDVGALSSSTVIPTISDTYNASSSNGMSGKAVASAISTKQDTINDLSTIRTNAEAGAGAASTIAGYGDIVTHDASEFLTEHQDISGKQDKIDNTHKLSADLVDDSTTTNKFVTTGEKNTWNAKQDTITDINTIRTNASAGKSAKDAVDAMGDIVSHDADEFAEAEHTHNISDVSNLQTTLDGKQAQITSSNKLSADLLSEGTTNKLVSASEKTTWNAKQSAITNSNKLSADLITDETTNNKFVSSTDKTAWNNAVTTISGYGDIVTHDADEFLTEHQDISGKADLSALSEVALSGSYNDLDDKPSIPSTYSDVGAASAAHTHSYSDVGAASAAHKHTSSDVTDLSTTISTAISGKANSTEVYNKTEIDGMLASGMHYKGTKASASALPTSGNKVGDLWNVEDTGANYAWNGTSWDKLSENIDLSGLVPNTRTVNGKALSSDISLTYTDVSAASSAHTHSYSDVGAASAAHTHSYTYSDVGAASADHTHTYSDVGAASASHTHSNYVVNTRKINNKALSADITLSASDVKALPDSTVIPVVPTNVSAFTNDAGYLTEHQDISGKANTSDLSDVAFSGDYDDLENKPSIPSTYSDVGAASAGHTHSNYVPTSRTINSKKLTGNITLSASDVGALPDSTVIPVVPTNVSAFTNDAGYLTEHQDISGKQDKTTAVTHTASTSVGNSTTPVYVASDGKATALSYTIEKSVPSDAKFSDTTYTAGSGLSLSGTEFKHSNSITAGTAGTTAATSGSTLAVPYVTYDAQGHITAKGTHTHTVTGFLVEADIAGKADTSSLADVAFSGSYTDLDDKPTIPTTYSDVGAASAGHTHTYSDVGAASSGHTHSNYVPTSRKVAGKALTSDISLTYSDVGAASSGHTHTYSDVGAASSGHTHSNYVATSRKVAGHALTADVTLSSADIGDLDTTISSAISGKANTTEVYSKSEIDGKLSGAMHFKGTKASASALPTTGNTQGDMWNVTDTGANYAWDGSAWDKLSENIDLSGLVPNTRKVNNKALSADITLGYSDVGAASSAHTHSYSDVGAASAAHTHSDYVPTTRKVAGKALSSDVTLTYSDVGAASSGHTHSGYVPTTRTINSKALSSNITLSASDVDAAASDHTHTYSEVGAASSAHTHTYSDVGAASSGHTHSNYVPTSRKVAGKALTSDISLTYSDVSAASAGHTHSYSDVGAASEAHTHSYTYSDVGAASAAHTHSTYVPTTRKVAGKALSSDITLTYSDVGALSAGTSIPSTYSDVGAASSAHTHSGYVPTSRTVNGKALSSNITIAPADVTMTGYVIASASASVTTSDTLNQAIAKIEYKANQAASGSVTVGQLNGPRITPSNPTVTVSVSGSTVTIDGVAYTEGDLVTAILAGTAPSTLEIVTHNNLRCYVFNSHYYRRDTLADIT